MEHKDKVQAIQFICPGAEFTLRGDEIEWLDENYNQPSDEQIAEAWLAYQEKVATDKINEEKKRQAILDRLGITADEAKLLLS